MTRTEKQYAAYLWFKGRDTYDIGKQLNLPEAEVESMIYDWLHAKRKRAA